MWRRIVSWLAPTAPACAASTELRKAAADLTRSARRLELSSLTLAARGAPPGDDYERQLFDATERLRTITDDTAARLRARTKGDDHHE